MKRKHDVYGIGNAIVDLQLKVSEEQFVGLGLEKGGVMLVDTDEQAQLISKFEGFDINRASGGSVANSIVAIAQLGGNAAFGCMVAADDFGSFYESDMTSLGVHVYTTPLEEPQTGSTIILVTPDAERTMNTNLGASALFGAEHVSASVTEDSEWLFVEGYLFASPPSQEAVRSGIRYATNSETKIAITFSDAFIIDVFGDELRKAVKYADLIFANVNEAARFTKESDEDKIFEKLRESAPNVVMTRSERGARVCFDGTCFETEAFATTAVDATGAGDMFAGAFLYGITNGFGAEESTKLACYLASKVVSQMGPRLPQVPEKDVVVQELRASVG